MKRPNWMTIIVYVLLVVFATAVLFPPSHRVMVPSPKVIERSNAKEIALAVMMYIGDYDDKFPLTNSAVQVGKSLKPYLPKSTISIRISGSDLSAKASSYVWNAKLSGVDSKNLTGSMPWLFYNPQSFDGKFYFARSDFQVALVSHSDLESAIDKSVSLKQNPVK